VVWITAATLLCYVAVLVIFGSHTNARVGDIGGLLIVICGVLCLNAETVASQTNVTGHESGGC